MGKILSSIFGGGDKPKVSEQPVQDTEDDKKKAKTARNAIFATEGGVVGQEIGAGGVAKRDTLFGN